MSKTAITGQVYRPQLTRWCRRNKLNQEPSILYVRQNEIASRHHQRLLDDSPHFLFIAKCLNFNICCPVGPPGYGISLACGIQKMQIVMKCAFQYTTRSIPWASHFHLFGQAATTHHFCWNCKKRFYALHYTWICCIQFRNK